MPQGASSIRENAASHLSLPFRGSLAKSETPDAMTSIEADTVCCNAFQGDRDPASILPAMSGIIVIQHQP